MGAPYRSRSDQYGHNVSKKPNVPLFQRPTSRAPSSALPCSGVRPVDLIGLFFRKVLNSGTSWKR